jgi:hypothetical protein
MRGCRQARVEDFERCGAVGRGDGYAVAAALLGLVEGRVGGREKVD